ncbi:polysaccharide lyase 8 family protein [Ralstonia sp.]|uniref:polysaccharide lyase 8 family protein n=1 Tax=Ralstonia sp. TaxID=54061 RepID=UPI0031DF3723
MLMSHTPAKLRTSLAIALAVSALMSGCGGDGSNAVTTQAAPTSTSLKPKDAGNPTTAAMRTAWQTYITGGTLNLSDSDISNKVTAIGNTANNDQNSMIAAGSRTTCLWSDLCTWTASSNLTNNYKRVQEMMLGYSTQGSSLYHDATLLANITDALQWLHDNRYNENVAQYDNWWDWEIGIPKILGNILITMYDQLPSTLTNSYIVAMDHFNADPTNETWPATTPPTVMTGANLLDKVIGRVFSGMLADDTTKIDAARTAMQAVYPLVTSDDGFYADGSFIQHHSIAYMGGYGGPMIDDVSNLMYLTNGTQWAFSSTELQTVAGWVNNSITPLMYQGAMMDMTRGRKISRSSETDHVDGRTMAASVRRLTDGFDATTAAAINATVKGWIQGDTVYSQASPCTSNCYYSGFSLYDMTKMKALAADSTVTPTTLQTSRIYGSMARAVHFNPTTNPNTTTKSPFGFALSMFSDRISSFEFGNNENKQGWLTGAGMTAVNTDDEKQFGGNFWATVDYNRLPGITSDGAAFTSPTAWAFYGNALGNLRWTGGSSVLSAYTSAGMEFDMSGFFSQEGLGRASPSNLTGRKSWFMMDDRIVAVGSDIADNVSTPVETIVDNRRLQAPWTGNAGGSNKLTINNSNYAPAALGAGPQTATAVKWAHVQGGVVSTCSPAVNPPCPTGSKGVGYMFFSPQTVTVLREARTSSWSAVGTGSTASVTDNYLSLALPHGTNPTAASYAYVLLPNKSAAEVNTLYANSGLSLLSSGSNGNGIHAVKYTPSSGTVTKVVGANFWLPAGGTVNDGSQSYLTSSTKASVTVAETATGVSLAVSDPTEANTGSITVTLNHGASSAGTLDSAVTVIQLQPTIKFAVNVNAAHGRSIAANFNY